MAPRPPLRPAPREVGDLIRRLEHLTPKRVRRILLLANRHDAFVFAEDGQVQDLLLAELADAAPRDAPWLVRYSTAKEALAALASGRPRFDCVVATVHVSDMDVVDFARQVHEQRRGVPVAVLAFDARELADVRNRDLRGVERVYAWQGDHRILLAIIKSLEDRWNVGRDTAEVGVASILLVEDSVRYYSAFLPKLYAELVEQSRRVLAEGTSAVHRLMRMRARPKVLHSTTFEEAIAWFRAYRGTILGLITDADFPRDGVACPQAGIELAQLVRSEAPDLPVLVQTSDQETASKARSLGFEVVLKGSPTLLEELSGFLHDQLGFGDLVFRDKAGREVGRARDLRELEQQIRSVPDESILRHAVGNHFSRWLRVRTEFGLADEIRPRKVTEFPTVAQMRTFIADAVRDYRRDRQSAVVSDFDPLTFEPETSFARIGSGSLGGKARGLALARRLLHEHGVRDRFPGARIVCPSAVVLATDVFDRFLDENDLRDFALNEGEDEVIERRFLEASFPSDAWAALREHLASATYPVAVRSSSLLEDSQRLPFAGMYRTYVLPNSHPDLEARLTDLVAAVKRVWASTYFRCVKNYVSGTPYRLEEEKMAVLVQRLVGARHGNRFYPDFAGVARSHDFYPSPPIESEDGVATVALGLGHTVVEGGRSLRFCPRYPLHAIPSSPKLVLPRAQTEFRALDLSDAREPGTEPQLALYGIDAAREDGTLAPLASTYSHAEDRLSDGLGRTGAPVVTFAPLLRDATFPLARILHALLVHGRADMELPVEIEFAVNLSVPPGETPEFAVVQMRPFAVGADHEDVDLSQIQAARLVVRSTQSMGNGRIEGLHDVVFVRREGFERRLTREIAADIGRINARLAAEGRPYVLIGMGRWGSSDPWLGIPVTWDQIRGARAIVEAGFPDLDVVPSQGSHFFHNLTAELTAYITVNADGTQGEIDWAWLESQPAFEETQRVRHIRLEHPLASVIDGRTGRGAIVRP
jgi:CheY-like chemotaxis protein